MRRTVFSPWKQYVVGVGLLIAISMFSLFFLVETAEAPFVSGKERAVEVATRYADLTHTQEVQRYNGAETYYSIQGKNSQNEKILVLVPEDSSDIFLYQMKDGISQEEAERIAQENGAGETERAVLGYAKGQAIWEIKSGSAYYLIAFETGDFVKKEGL